MAAHLEPYKPDDEEKCRYFYGRAGRPRLVARTSTTSWIKPQHPEGWHNTFVQTPKRYFPITEEEIVSKWNKDLSSAIIEVLKGCSWSYFFPIRIGLERIRGQESTDGQGEDKNPTVLSIAVEEDSLQWEEGITIASACRRVLQRFLIPNVEVEIREGRFEHHAACEQLESQIDPDRWLDDDTNGRALPLLSTSGYPIGYLDESVGQGTVGLHLRLSQDHSPAAFYGLTCRHVVCKDRPNHDSYKISGDYRQYHVQGNHTGFDDCLTDLKEYQEKLESFIKPLLDAKTRWEEWYQYDESLKHKCPTEAQMAGLNRRQNQAAYNETIIRHSEILRPKEKRKIGHLAYHPSYEVSSLQPGYLKDWALVELDPTKFLKGPENKVFIGTRDVDFQTKDENGFLDLFLGDEEAFAKGVIVGKRGSATGLTFGRISGIEAVLRTPGLVGKDTSTFEMLIVPEKGYKKFSERGDSGSPIFDCFGQIIGMLVGSTDFRPEDTWRGVCEPGSSNSRILKRFPGSNKSPVADETSKDELAKFTEEMDVTFAAPIKWVLEDIQDFTGLQTRLA
ncbi:hypothetical protein F4678DRAFT_459198 [Xylaria arbuscula]|nr:hypothetical protein F4678DRAFT_459198 [Xylaria arbuscula]